MKRSTGAPILDDMLRGGFPEDRTVLFTGGPGTGKTTLAMQFLQAGVERGESCLFVSTEQTPSELRDSFDPYRFTFDSENLALTTLHATPGSTVESGEDVLTLDVLGDDTTDPMPDGSGAAKTGGGMASTDEGTPPSFGEYRQPFKSEHVLDYLRQYAPRDRVVFDSVSGLSAIASEMESFRRSILDLFRLFTDEFGATTVLTAEASHDTSQGISEMLRYNTHGVIELWREQVEGDYHRFIEIAKMRGVDHSTRPYEMEFNSDGVALLPKVRAPAEGLHSYDYLTTGVRGLDDLCGGGLIEGETTLLEHDGRAAVEGLVTSVVVEALRNDHSVLLVPPSNLSASDLDETLSDRVDDVHSLMEEDRLFVLDLIGTWSGFHENVFGISGIERHLRDLIGGIKPLVSWRIRRTFQQIDTRRDDRKVLIVTFTESMLQEFDPEEVRDIYHWGNRTLRNVDDSVLFVQNPGVMEKRLAEFFVYDAKQLLRTWSHSNGLQYVKLEKSPTGRIGNTRLVEFIDYPPYVRIQQPDGPSITSVNDEGDHS